MFSIAIQAGGQSKRMGSDKALLPFINQTLIEYVIERVRPIADELLITSNNLEAYISFGVPIYQDILPERGALGGLFTALSVAAHPYVGVIACDMPFVCPDLLLAEYNLLVDQQFDAVIPKTQQGTEPFHAVYRSNICLPAIREAIKAGELRMDAWFSKVHVRYLSSVEIETYDPSKLAFWNINTPEDLVKAQDLIKQSD